ncbi:hypothetical protein KG892_02840 [Vermiphilus pyriformis]|nr:MAG: hypothetical protein KG892_02840 [Vermiphilus pyriformis]
MKFLSRIVLVLGTSVSFASYSNQVVIVPSWKTKLAAVSQFALGTYALGTGIKVAFKGCENLSSVIKARMTKPEQRTVEQHMIASIPNKYLAIGVSGTTWVAGLSGYVAYKALQPFFTNYVRARWYYLYKNGSTLREVRTITTVQ